MHFIEVNRSLQIMVDIIYITTLGIFWLITWNVPLHSCDHSKTISSHSVSCMNIILNDGNRNIGVTVNYSFRMSPIWPFELTTFKLDSVADITD